MMHPIHKNHSGHLQKHIGSFYVRLYCINSYEELKTMNTCIYCPNKRIFTFDCNDI